MRGMDAELRLQGGIYAVLWNKYPVMNRSIYKSWLIKPTANLTLT